MTYSIVARDPETGVFGMAVQSYPLAVGSVVPWGKAGVGAVATQALVLPSYGPLGIERLDCELRAHDGAVRCRQRAAMGARLFRR